MKHALFVQTAFLSASHFFVRVIGLIMRIWLSRSLGAAAIGLVELAQSAQMLLITPVVSGLPAAVSRLSAKHTDDAGMQTRALRCGIALSLWVSVPLMFSAFFLRNVLARWLGDMGTLPALLVYLPCIPILGISCALNGFCYGTGRTVAPAIGEIMEQLVRFVLTVRLVGLLKKLPHPLIAAIPAAATLAGETISLAFTLALCAPALLAGHSRAHMRSMRAEMIALALPLTGMRLVSSLMRTVCATLIPQRLQFSGLSRTDALSQLGMMNGMIMPMLTLPSFVTCSLCMVAAPELTRRQAQHRALKPICRTILFASFCIGLLASGAVHLFSPFIANRLYHQPQLEPYLRVCSALIPVMALCQTVGGIMNGLGLQGSSLRISLASSLAHTILTWLLAAVPSLRLGGVMIAMAVSQFITLVLSLRAIRPQINPD